MKFNIFLNKLNFVAIGLLFQTSQVGANSAPELDLQDWIVGKGNDLTFVVVPKDEDGVVPGLYMLGAPDDAILIDNGDGTRTFSWQPQDSGVYSVDFVVKDAQDSSLSNRYKSKIVVVEPGEDAPIEGTSAVNGNSVAIDVLANSESEYQANQEPQNEFHLGDQPGTVTKVLDKLSVSKSQVNVLQTPVDTGDGFLYTVNIEPGPSGDKEGFDLLTVLRQGKQNQNNAWEWKSVVVDNRTLYNRWHTAPSVGVDKSGELHVAYNMHNFPWQYKRSERAHDIYSLKFEGQQLTDQALKLSAEQNKTDFPTLGSAAIPGNQITYPAFYKDNNNDLYVSYRFAATPMRQFARRTMSTGIAVYNASTHTWSPIGRGFNHQDGDFKADSASTKVAVPFAAKTGWTSYLPRLAFDSTNKMIVTLFWREGTAGQSVKMPCIAQTENRIDATDMAGMPMSLPIKPEYCGNMDISNDEEFYTIGSFTVDADSQPHLLVSPKNGYRYISRYIRSEQRWIKEKAPEGATEIFFDQDNNLFAIASGIKIFKRSSGQESWEEIYSDESSSNCYPKVNLDKSGNNAFIHTHSCDEKSVTIYGLRLK